MECNASSSVNEGCRNYGSLDKAANALDGFIRVNFFGCTDASAQCEENNSKVSSTDIVRSLTFDGKYFLLKSAKSIELIYMAKCLLIDRGSEIDECFRKSICLSRLCQLWQYILDEVAEELKIIGDVQEEKGKNFDVSELALAEFLLERVHINLLYYEYDRALAALNCSSEILKISAKFTGALGRRTIYQEHDVAQLVVQITDCGSNSVEFETDILMETLTNVELNDDCLLETVQYSSPSNTLIEARITKFTAAFLLAACAYIRKTEPNDELMMEKCMVYVDKIIVASKYGVALCSALVLRSELEKTKRRRVERACSQMEELVKMLGGGYGKRFDCAPVELVLASGLHPNWKLKQIYASLLRSLGCTSEALHEYERLEDWDEVIDCYKAMGQLEKAEGLIRSLIEQDPKCPRYYCFLGDLTDSTKYYEKAIEVSNGRSARAYRSFGNLLLKFKKYSEAIEKYKISLSLQPLQLDVWFNLGYCAWRSEIYQEAANAFHHCVQLEPEHFEAWNNLSAVCIKMDQKPKAMKFMQEALKGNYDHAPMWETCLLLSIDTGELVLAIKALHRILDLRKKYTDHEVLEVLLEKVIAIVTQDDNLSLRLKEEMCKLLGRLTSSQTCSAKVWSSYAELKKPSKVPSAIVQEKYCELLDRARKMSLQDLCKSEDACIDCIALTLRYIDEFNTLARLMNYDGDRVNSSNRLILRPMISQIEKKFCYDTEKAVSEMLAEYLSKLRNCLSLYT